MCVSSALGLALGVGGAVLAAGLALWFMHISQQTDVDGGIPSNETYARTSPQFEDDQQISAVRKSNHSVQIPTEGKGAEVGQGAGARGSRERCRDQS